ncbi:DUF6090 family protein [Robiginitalea marina]|uniref:DUF6090 family protein n=1 Tax=Robiginitalea marina TaxID=2954105 RepID=A0ABT1AV63_9FLAO|nr:DUF6090 family protein [Robiginitalea marina]MCO5723887.1 DUF6090 family protein [Robiginitalea marina]
MEKNKTGTYLKYAIGEIILVVIGILIALQINNWNENRNTHNLSKIYLNNIKKDLITDTITFQSGIKRFENSLVLQGDLFNPVKVNILPVDSLFSAINTAFHSARIYKINNSTYLKLTNSGFVESKFFNEIFIDINNYYTKEYNTWLEYLEWDKENGTTIYQPESFIRLYDIIDFPDFEKQLKSEFQTSIEKEYKVAFREYIKSPNFRNYAWKSHKEMKALLEKMKYQKSVTSELIEKINNELKK